MAQERVAVDFSFFDARKYRTLEVEEGYREWVQTYEETVLDVMDLRLLNRIQTVRWGRVQHAIDLACGTGRIGTWLSQQGVRDVDGLDLTAAMLEVARTKGVYRNLLRGNMLETPFPENGYDLAVEVLADEHIPDLAPLYREAARVTTAGAPFVLVGYHPHFLMGGIPTHFELNGESVAIESYVHLLSDHVKAAHDAGWILREMDEGLVDEEWIARKPKWEKYRQHPVSFSTVWRKAAFPGRR